MPARPSPNPSDRRCASPTVARTSDRESDCLVLAFGQLDATDGAMLIKVIARVVELERSHGEDVALAMLGPLADPRAIANFNHQFGLDRPLLIQYGEWVGHFVTGDMGLSYALRTPVAPMIATALGHSLKLGAVAFADLVPTVALAIFSGAFADRMGFMRIIRVSPIAPSSSTRPASVAQPGGAARNTYHWTMMTPR